MIVFLSVYVKVSSLLLDSVPVFCLLFVFIPFSKNLLFGSIIMIYISTLVVALKLIIQHNENYPV